MSGRFFRGGRSAMHNLLHQTRRSHRMTMQPTQQTFSITFTAPSAMMAAGSSLPPITSNQSAIGSTTSNGLRSSSTTTSGSKGCGSPSCCQGMSAITAGEDGEEPFIGAPSLSSFNNQSPMRGVSASANDQSSLCNSNKNNNTSTSSPSSPSTLSPSNNTPSDSSNPPPPRQKCDPYEQGGHPLSTSVVQQHMRVTLDPSWQYDETKRILVRSFEFGRSFQRGDDVKHLFGFVSELGNIQSYGAHPLYNMNLNLRANSLQVMLRTVPLRGISYQDLMLATKIDGMWFRLQLKEQERKKKDQHQSPNTSKQ